MLHVGEPLVVEPGIYPGLRRADYDRISYLSQTVLKKWIDFCELPSEFAYWLAHRNEHKTEALLIGNAVDILTIEGESEFYAKFIAVPDDPPRRPSVKQRAAKKQSQATLDAIEFWDQFDRQAEGREVIDAEQWRSVWLMVESLHTSELTRDMYENCSKTALIAELFGQPCKAEVDLWACETEHIGDQKIARDITPSGFWKVFWDFGYHYQATFYLALANVLGIKKTVFDFVCVKSTEPWTTRVYSFAPNKNSRHQDLFDSTLRALEIAMTQLCPRLDSGDFTDRREWELLQIPDWALRRINA